MSSMVFLLLFQSIPIQTLAEVAASLARISACELGSAEEEGEVQWRALGSKWQT